VARWRLVHRFEEKLAELQERAARGGGGRRQKDARVDEMTKIEIVFHGTPRRNVAGIVQHGFLVPGRKGLGEKVEVRCGSTWGQGIYSSPNPTYCISYTDTTSNEGANGRSLLPGMKLIVCAVLMGRRRQLRQSEYRRSNDSAIYSYDSHVSPSGQEWIVFDERQIIPLIVLHLGQKQQKPVNRAEDVSKKMKEVRMKMSAMKNLPFGFGPAGKNCVIEDIAEIDEDDEEWGDYVDMRMDGNEMDEFSGFARG